MGKDARKGDRHKPRKGDRHKPRKGSRHNPETRRAYEASPTRRAYKRMRNRLRTLKPDFAPRNQMARRRSKYGIGPRDYWDLFDFQDGRCALCGKELEPNRQMDVDHEGGKRTHGDWTKVRAILHPFCNRRVNDNSLESAKQMVAYLSAPPAWDLWERPPSLDEAESASTFAKQTASRRLP